MLYNVLVRFALSERVGTPSTENIQVFLVTSLELKNQELQRRFFLKIYLFLICFLYKLENVQIAALVSSEFGVEFKMMEKVNVKGSNVNPVWRYLTGTLNISHRCFTGTAITYLYSVATELTSFLFHLAQHFY